MNTYKPDTFYDTSKITAEEQKALLYKAHSICEKWWLDKLNCDVSWARQRVDNIAFEDAMKLYKPPITVIHRRMEFFNEKDYIEAGFRAMHGEVDYFIWIQVSVENASTVIKGLEILH